MLHTIIFSTLGQLATGILLFIALVPPSQIGRGFGRFHTMLALALWWIAVRFSISPGIIILSALLTLSFLFAARNTAYYPFLALSLMASVYMLNGESLNGIATGLRQHLVPVLVLGASSVAMLLGHWYLVAPKLSIKYLKILTIGLIVSLLVRTAVTTGSLIVDSSRLAEIHFYQVYGIFLLQRVVLGMVLTLVLSILTYLCVRIRSTQSATGILYVVLVFCLIGELLGTYLFQKTGVLL